MVRTQFPLKFVILWTNSCRYSVKDKLTITSKSMCFTLFSLDRFSESGFCGKVFNEARVKLATLVLKTDLRIELLNTRTGPIVFEPSRAQSQILGDPLRPKLGSLEGIFI